MAVIIFCFCSVDREDFCFYFPLMAIFVIVISQFSNVF